jgi:GNAT superfamily N-acetyltransferase
MWTLDKKREDCFRAPMGRDLVRPDTTIVERPGWYQVITPSAPSGVLNEVVWSDVAEADAERVIDETVAAYRANGHRTKWCVGYWTKPHDFGERLSRRRFTSWDVRGMGRDTGNELSFPDGVRVEEVTESDVSAYVAAMLRGWSLSGEQASVEGHVHLRAFSAVPRAAHFFVALDGTEIVGTAALLLRGDHGYLSGTQVLEAARGRGFYRALVAARLKHLRDRGIGYAVTQAREATSAPILERLGFETLFRSKCYLSDAAGTESSST